MKFVRSTRCSILPLVAYLPVHGAATHHRHASQARNRAFTLIEVLVVVAIIALLTAVLMPSMNKAREVSKQTVCASNMRQQGLGFSGYSADNKTRLPWAAKFRYGLMEGLYYHGYCDNHSSDWATFNSGSLYPKYVGNNAQIFYCPSGNTFDAQHKNNGVAKFLSVFRNPAGANSHNEPDVPYYSYLYAFPVANGRSPSDAASKMYPDESMQYAWAPTHLACYKPPNPPVEALYWQFLRDTAEPDPSFLGMFPQKQRGKHNLHALLSDGYASDGNMTRQMMGYHGGNYDGGYNVLFSDFHVKWVKDPARKIFSAQLCPPYTAYGGINDARTKVYLVWEYFSRNP